MNFPSPSLTLRAMLLLVGFTSVTVQALSFGAGPKLGANFAGADVEGIDDEERRTGLVLGVVTEFGVTSPFSLVLEPSYVQRGARFEALGARARGDIDYIELPVLAKAKFGNLKTAHAYLFLGPSFGLKSTSEGRYLGVTDAFEEQIATFSLSGDIGAGVAYRISPFVYLAADLRYSHGFTNALEEDIATIESWYSRDVRAAGALLFHLIE